MKSQLQVADLRLTALASLSAPRRILYMIASPPPCRLANLLNATWYSSSTCAIVWLHCICLCRLASSFIRDLNNKGNRPMNGF
jgi:hypothetical protein